MPGPPSKATIDQRDRVLALAEAGRSYSDVAAEVFGDARLRGRVERIVRRAKSRPANAPPLDELVARLNRAGDAHRAPEPDSWLEQLVPLYGGVLKQRLEAGLPVKPRELLAFFALEQRLDNARAIDRLNALTRGLA